MATAQAAAEAALSNTAMRPSPNPLTTVPAWALTTPWSSSSCSRRTSSAATSPNRERKAVEPTTSVNSTVRVPDPRDAPSSTGGGYAASVVPRPVSGPVGAAEYHETTPAWPGSEGVVTQASRFPPWRATPHQTRRMAAWIGFSGSRRHQLELERDARNVGYLADATRLAHAQTSEVLSQTTLPAVA